MPSVLKRPGEAEVIGGKLRTLRLTNAEIERFEVEYAPLGALELLMQLTEPGRQPLVLHVRAIIGLGLVGGGMSEREAARLIDEQPPSENFALRGVAQRLMGVTFFPAVLDEGKRPRKKRGGPPETGSGPQPDTTPDPGSPISAA